MDVLLRRAERWTARGGRLLARTMPGLSDAYRRRKVQRFVEWMRREAADDYGRIERAPLPEPVRARAIRVLADAGDSGALTAAVERIDADVVYVAPSAAPDVIKDVAALKRVDPAIRCVLFTQHLGAVEALARRYFDEVVVFADAGDFVRRLKSTRAQTLILRLATRTIELAALARVFWDARFVYRPSGFLTQMDGDVGWREWTATELFLLEKFIVEHADAIYHFYSHAAVERLRRDGMQITCAADAIYPACISELGPARRLGRRSAVTGEIHLAYAAGLSGRDTGGAFWLADKWRQVTSQGIHVHVYTPYSGWEAPQLAAYRDLAAASPYLHLERSLQYDELLVALTQYDYAFQHWDFGLRRCKPEFNYHLPNNFWTYVQAGLPIIASDSTEAQVDFVTRHGAGIILGEQDIPQLRNILERLDRPRVEEQLRIARDASEFDARGLWRLVTGREAA